MMGLLLAIFCFVQPEDESTYYGMDMAIARFSRYWNNVFETSAHGFRTSQGCHDMRHWYQIYEVKTEASFTRVFSLRYDFYMLRDYETSITRHRFEPTVRLAKDFYLHAVAVPSYYKKEDEAGVGLAWRRGERNWLALYGIAQSFDHNMSLKYTPAGPLNDSFVKIPYRLDIDGRGELDWMRLRIHSELGTRSRQRLCWPDSTLNEWDKERDRSTVWGRAEFEPLEGLWVGGNFSWTMDRSRTSWPEQSRVTADTVRDWWVEPAISFSPTQRLELSASYQVWRMERDMDSVSYRRDYDILTSLVTWNPLPFLVLEAGYQRALRSIWNDEVLITEPYSGVLRQSRLLFNAELRFSSGAMVVVKEGIETDRFPRETFWHPHNHTYVALYLPLTAFKDRGREPD